VARRSSEGPERRERLQAQGRLLLAIDGLQPDVGHEVLWGGREGLSREVLLARRLLSAAERELTPLLREAVAGLEVPVVGAVSDGPHAIRHAVAAAFPGQPHQRCHFHYVRQAAGPIWEADRQAKKALKKRVRGIRPLERAVEGREDEEAEIVQGDGAAVRSALSEDGRAPLEPSGLELEERLSAMAASLDRVTERKGGSLGYARHGKRLRRSGPRCERPVPGGTRRPRSWRTGPTRPVRPCVDTTKRSWSGCARRPRRPASRQGAVEHCLKVTQSYWLGLFHGYEVEGLPRTNNDLEQFFGAIRHRERRCSGHKRASSTRVGRGAVRVLAATVTRLCPPTPEQLAPRDLDAWRTQRHRLKHCQHARVLQCRFRRQPDAYLAALEERLVKLSLPP
jgi:hypothetical protein